jgi:cell division protein FtsB
MSDEAQDLERQQQAEQAEYDRVAAEIAQLESRIADLQTEQEARRLRIAALARRRMDWWER